MTKDYKKPSSKRKRSKQTHREWYFFGAGLSIGLVLAIFAYVRGIEGSTVTTPLAADSALQSQTATANTETSTPREPEDSELEPRFTFYDDLPRVEVSVPAASKNAARPATNKSGQAAKPATDPNQSYLLQAGSFQEYEDAEQIKAELALLGIRAFIEDAKTDDGQTWHRVRIGPFNDLEQAYNTQSTLVDHEFDTLIVRN